mgnify:CR=1 FL=1
MTTSLDNYQRFIHVSRYARYIPELKRRETYEENQKALSVQTLRKSIENLDYDSGAHIWHIPFYRQAFEESNDTSDDESDSSDDDSDNL